MMTATRSVMPRLPLLLVMGALMLSACARDDDRRDEDTSTREDGLGTISRAGSGFSLPAAVFTEVVSGARHTCALERSGLPYCWGLNDRGQTRAPDVQLGALTAGGAHTCGLDRAGQLRCWGDVVPPGTPTDAGPIGLDAGVSSATGFSEIASGDGIVCGLAFDGTVRCSGWPGSLLPTGTSTGLSRIDHVGTNGSTVLVSGIQRSTGFASVTSRGSLFAPPDALWAQFGQPLEIALGARHACIATDLGRLLCWGDDGAGQVSGPGYDPAHPTRRRATQTVADARVWVFSGPGAWRSVTAGDSFTCTLNDERALAEGAASNALCWGAGGAGQLTPPPVRFTAISAGVEHVCGIAEGSGAIWCWGDDSYGQSRPPRTVRLIRAR